MHQINLERVMIRVCSLAALCILSLTACMQENYAPLPVYSYSLMHLDELGNITQLPMPALYPSRLKFEWISGGRILALHDSLHIYDPSSGTLDNITPNPMFNYDYYRNYDLSPDRLWLYYDAGGKIYRLNLQNYVLETIIESETASFYLPTISWDGRYLCFLNCPSPPSMYSHQGGFVCWKDLQTGIVSSLPTGNTNLDRSVLYAWMPMGGKCIYYHQNSILMRMNSDGSNRQEVLSGLVQSRDSYDQRHLLCLKENPYFYAYLIYRDNSSLTWQDIGSAGHFSLCRSANILYYTYSGKLTRFDLNSGSKTTLLANSFEDKSIHSIGAIAPSWDGKELYFLITFVDKGKSAYRSIL